MGKLDTYDTLKFNTYYNSLVGNNEVDLTKLLGKQMARFSTPSASLTRNRYKFKKVKFADQKQLSEFGLKRTHNYSTEPIRVSYLRF